MINQPMTLDSPRSRCYLCDGSSFKPRPGKVRDAPGLSILECQVCGLVTLSSHEHIQAGHYEQSAMHGDTLKPIEVLLRDSDFDDARRFEMLRGCLPNKRLLDFGCGNAGFLMRASELAASVVGVEVEMRVRDYWGDRLRILPDLPPPPLSHIQTDCGKVTKQIFSTCSRHFM